MMASDRQRFSERLLLLAEGRGKLLTPSMLDGLWALLVDLPWPRVEGGLLVSARDDRYFPQADRIRARIEDLERAEARQLAAQQRPIPDGDVECEQCTDTGWQPVLRESGSLVPMAALVGVAPSDYGLRPCTCRAWNRTYQARRAAESRPARESAS